MVLRTGTKPITMIEFAFGGFRVGNRNIIVATV
jgi:hypothetical protein